MCGIAGFLDCPTTDPATVLARMTAALMHRGPDDTGAWHDDRVWLGHRRLSVIDVHGGRQPMVSDDGTIAVVFNGEIYNHLPLRRELEQGGACFHTCCDTEVLLHLWRVHGVEMLARLRGMFAFAIRDTRQGTLFLARDRLGKKPLFYATPGAGLVFASELHALHSHPAMPNTADVAALRLFFRYGYIPAPRTAWVGVRELPPASALLWQNGTLREWTYWHLRRNPDPHMSEDAAREELDARLDEAVRLRLPSDVPLGAFLSGGLDSSLVAWHMQRHLGGTLKTFAIGFDADGWDESAHAERVAKHLGTEHRCRMVHPAGAQMLDAIARHFGEPFGDSSAIPMWHLSKFAREHVTVALSGDGADELFGGYARYLARRLHAYYRVLPAAVRRNTVGRILACLPDHTGYLRTSVIKMLRQFDRAAMILDAEPDNPAGRIFSPAELSALLPGKDDGCDPVAEQARALSSLAPVEQLMALDTVTYLPFDINAKVDRMSMAHGLEVRCPFLDQELAEFAARVPLSFKLRGCQGKYLLKKLAAGRLPEATILRKKHGFGVPLGDWFLGPLDEVWHATVTQDTLGPLDAASVNRLWLEHRRRTCDRAYHLWHILVFCHWMRTTRPSFA